MRILRTRPNTPEFIAQQLQILRTMQAEQETVRAPAADAKGPKAKRLSPHPRSTGCARNTSLTS
ncbi:hypothetical protein BGY98DRAFT_1030239 [Russula aff. rugulosa BPL654]|nr:hypothetical protein BGY98DRAFT_1030239 [Russula aff. rugulosa BPL654]